MSKTWYPVIDYDKCSGCLACYEKCSHGVYELNSRDFPKVVLPEECLHGCTGCGSLCPEEAITYMGDTKDVKKSCCNDNEETSSCCSDSDDKDSGCCSDSDDKKGGCCNEDESPKADKGCGCSCGCS